MKNYFKFLALGMALMLCLFAFTSCGNAISVDDVKADPFGAVSTAYDKYFEAIDDKYGAFFDVFDAEETDAGKLKLAFSMKDVADAELLLAVDSEERVAADMKLSMSEIDASVKLWGEGEKIAFSIPELLGEGKYGFNTSTFEDDVKESPVFSEDFTYEDFEEYISDLLGVTVKDVTDAFEEHTGGTEVEKHIDEIKKMFEDMAPEITEESVDDAECISVEYKITKEDVEDVINGMLKAVKAELETVVPSEYIEIEEAALDDIDDMSAKFYIVKKTGAICRSVLTSGEDKITVNYSTDLKNPLNITFDVNADGDKITAELKEEATLKNVDIDFDVKIIEGEDEHTGGASLNYDVDGKKFDIEVIADDSKVFEADGTFEATKEKFEFTLDKIIVNDVNIDVKFAYSVEADSDLKVEKMPEYKDITDMDMDDFSALVQDIMNSEIGSSLFGAMQYFY